MKAVLLFAVATGLAFAGGYGAGRYETMPRPTVPVDAAPAALAGETIGSGPYYVEVGQLVVPMLAKGRTVAFILTQITLEAGSNDEANMVRRRLPHARSAMLETLFGLAGSGSFDGPAVDPLAVSAALLRSANGQYSSRPIRTVLIDRLLRQDNSRS
ncbi:hypothetical protein [Azospirillum doebereinerae]|uniref:Flagellar basal body-associated protein FliL n=1 Tax=Azospirillum doebereinerae TaxID=92933 RepID=A0A3S0V458_9PROT|nr:hypothetical protein [Azospirillum doebereinerae]MCG5240936.1 hypothetical protein [Azospirillum doebereinerae]RUQ66572.1 hypothetical protein EJ913_22335 [Azospirillum doebereinerae]